MTASVWVQGNLLRLDLPRMGRLTLTPVPMRRTPSQDPKVVQEVSSFASASVLSAEQAVAAREFLMLHDTACLTDGKQYFSVGKADALQACYADVVERLALDTVSALRAIGLQADAPGRVATPWGPSHALRFYGEGIVQAHGPGHWGIYVSPQMYQCMPSSLRAFHPFTKAFTKADGSPGQRWYEGTTDRSVVVLAFPERFEAIEVRRALLIGLRLSNSMRQLAFTEYLDTREGRDALAIVRAFERENAHRYDTASRFTGARETRVFARCIGDAAQCLEVRGHGAFGLPDVFTRGDVAALGLESTLTEDTNADGRAGTVAERCERLLGATPVSTELEAKTGGMRP